MPRENRPAYIQDTEQAIRAIHRIIKKHKEVFLDGDNEWQTRYSFVDPILSALRWDVSNPREVRIEYNKLETRGTPDYCLFGLDPKKPLIILEAKAIDNRDIHAFLSKEQSDLADFRSEYAKQLQEYVIETKARWGVLTNGACWDIYERAPRWARVDYFSILGETVEDGADRLKRFHHRNLQQLQ